MPCRVEDDDAEEAKLPVPEQESAGTDPDVPTKPIEEYFYLVGTQHWDDEDHFLYQTVRVDVYTDPVTKEEYIVGYRKRVLSNGRLASEVDDRSISGT